MIVGTKCKQTHACLIKTIFLRSRQEVNKPKVPTERDRNPTTNHRSNEYHNKLESNENTIIKGVENTATTTVATRITN